MYNNPKDLHAIQNMIWTGKGCYKMKIERRLALARGKALTPVRWDARLPEEALKLNAGITN